MKKLFSLLFISSLLLSYSVSAETTTSKVPLFQYDVYGFVRNDFTYDSRKTLGAVSELINFMPLQPEYNAFGEDLNAIPSTRYLAITTRLGLNINSTQKVLGAYAGAKIETDFCGYSVNTTMLRIRQAYFTLNWKQAVEENPLKQQLLLGQTWHPFSITMMPDILSLNAGSPFNPFNRSPMIRYKLMKSGFDFTAAAIWQFQYASVGPLGASDSYLNYSMVPELYLGVDYLFSEIGRAHV